MNLLIINTSEIADSGPIEGVVGSYVCPELDDVAQRQNLTVRYTISLIVDALLMRGTITGSVELACSCCLAGFDYPVSLSMAQSYPPSSTEVNVGAEVRELLVLAMPIKPMCSRECGGLCPTCGTNRNSGTCTHVESRPDDARWEKLQGLLKKER